MKEDFIFNEKDDEPDFHHTPYIFPSKAMPTTEEKSLLSSENSIEEESTSATKFGYTIMPSEISEELTSKKLKKNHKISSSLKEIPCDYVSTEADNLQVIFLMLDLKYSLEKLTSKLLICKETVKAYDVENGRLNTKKNILKKKLHLKVENLNRQLFCCGWCM